MDRTRARKRRPALAFASLPLPDEPPAPSPRRRKQKPARAKLPRGMQKAYELAHLQSSFGRSPARRSSRRPVEVDCTSANVAVRADRYRGVGVTYSPGSPVSAPASYRAADAEAGIPPRAPVSVQRRDLPPRATKRPGRNKGYAATSAPPAAGANVFVLARRGVAYLVIGALLAIIGLMAIELRKATASADDARRRSRSPGGAWADSFVASTENADAFEAIRVGRANAVERTARPVSEASKEVRRPTSESVSTAAVVRPGRAANAARGAPMRCFVLLRTTQQATAPRHPTVAMAAGGRALRNMQNAAARVGVRPSVGGVVDALRRFSSWEMFRQAERQLVMVLAPARYEIAMGPALAAGPSFTEGVVPLPTPWAD